MVGGADVPDSDRGDFRRWHAVDISSLCGISKGTFEIPHKISYPYIERHDFNTVLKF